MLGHKTNNMETSLNSLANKFKIQSLELGRTFIGLRFFTTY